MSIFCANNATFPSIQRKAPKTFYLIRKTKQQQNAKHENSALKANITISNPKSW